MFMKTTLLTDNENELLNNRSEIDKLVEKLKRVKKGFKTTAAQNFTNEFIDLSYNVNSLNLERVQNNNFNKQDELFERTKELFEKYEEFNNIFNQ
ncbi:hypothetical protein F3D3_2502 [Fusibacter sp. 3D3]|nr:hypothetical protein F3D3_2502 [Fusibacter sp. 3D3]